MAGAFAFGRNMTVSANAESVQPVAQVEKDEIVEEETIVETPAEEIKEEVAEKVQEAPAAKPEQKKSATTTARRTNSTTTRNSNNTTRTQAQTTTTAPASSSNNTYGIIEVEVKTSDKDVKMKSADASKAISDEEMDALFAD